MKKIVLAALLLVAAFGSKAQTLPLDLAAYRALLAGPSHYGCSIANCRTKAIQAAEADSLYGFLERMAALSASLGDLHTVLGLGNVSSIPVRIENTTFAFYTLHDHYGITTVHNPVGFMDVYPVTYLGWESSTPVLKIRDAFGYFGYIRAGTLTGTRKIRIPDEGDGLDWKSDAVIHETGTPTHVNQYPYGRTETGGGYTIWKDTTTGKIAKITTYSGTPALSLQDASSSYYSVIQSGSLSSDKPLLTPNTSGYIATRRDTIGDAVSDMPVLATQHYVDNSISSGSWNTSSLRWNGDYTQQVAGHAINFDSTLTFQIVDVNGNVVFAANTGTAFTPHLSGIFLPAPSVAGGAGAGSSPTVSLKSTSRDLSGCIEVTTGTGCSGSSIVATLTFNRAYGTAPYVVISPANDNAAALTGDKKVYVDVSTTTTTTFDIMSGATPLSDATAYKFTYVVIE